MGLMSRVKGKRYEQKIAALFRAHWPEAVVRRASQAERADNPDVMVEGPGVLERLWLELQDARSPTPLLKLGQAESDAFAWATAITGRPRRWPVVVWHRTGARDANATMPLWVVDEIRGVQERTFRAETVTMDLRDFVGLLKGATASKEAV